MAEGRAPEPRQAHAQIFYGCLKTIKKIKDRKDILEGQARFLFQYHLHLLY